jgi:hypothetical protein
MIFLRDYFLWPIVTLRLITRPIWKSSRNNIIFFNTIILCFCVFILALLDHFHHFVSSDDSGRASHQRTCHLMRCSVTVIWWDALSLSSDETLCHCHLMRRSVTVLWWDALPLSSDETKWWKWSKSARIKTQKQSIIVLKNMILLREHR